MEPVHRVEHAQGLRETITELGKRLSKGAKDETAHKRIDDLEAKMPTTEGIAGIAGGAVSVLLAEIRKDIIADRELVSAIRELVDVAKEILGRLPKA